MVMLSVVSLKMAMISNLTTPYIVTSKTKSLPRVLPGLLQKGLVFILPATQTVMVQSYAVVIFVDFVWNAKGAFGRTIRKIIFVAGEDPVAWWPCPCVMEVQFQLALEEVPIVFTGIEFRLGTGLANPGYSDKCQRTKNKDYYQQFDQTKRSVAVMHLRPQHRFLSQ